MTPVSVFCSVKCREASENKAFKTYGVSFNLVISSPDDLEVVRRAIEIVEFFRDVEKINSSFDRVVELSTETIKGREVDLETTIFKILTQDNSKK